MTAWDAEAYLRYADERTQPASDLAARIKVASPKRIIDLGCGPGNSTEVLRLRWPEAEMIGLDQSEEMIAAASKSYPHGKWVLKDLSTWTGEPPFDLVFSNAALQWVPNHDRLFPHLFAQVATGGALAVQMPAHHGSAAHQVILEVADDPAWSHLMSAPRSAMTRESPAFYYDVLQPLASRLEIWVTEYYHIMNGPEAMVEWFRGTGLRPFLSALETEGQKLSFEAKLLEGFSRFYPRQRDSRILFPFRRLFIVAYKA